MNSETLDTRTSSLAVKLNAKGEYHWDIKVYFDPDATTDNEVAEKVAQLDASLKAKFRSEQ